MMAFCLALFVMFFIHIFCYEIFKLTFYVSLAFVLIFLWFCLHSDHYTYPIMCPMGCCSVYSIFLVNILLCIKSVFSCIHFTNTGLMILQF